MAKRKPVRSSSGWLDGLKTILYAALIAILIRTVVAEPFNIPSSSMQATLLEGDYLFVSKFSYGYSRHSLPMSPNLFEGRILGRLPERGDVAVFKTPQDNATDYIKRIVGLPGDRIQVKGGLLHINDTPVQLEAVGTFTVHSINRATGNANPPVEARRYIETLPGGRRHFILDLSEFGPGDNTAEFLVPAGHVFAMGDNRDASLDSRFQTDGGPGFIPIANLVGRAEFLFFSVDEARGRWLAPWTWPFAIRWSRLLDAIDSDVPEARR
jgi:signal peptidase I